MRPRSAVQRARLIWPLGALGVTLVFALARLAVVPRFFYSDDTERGSAGQWWHLGDQLLQGHLPLLNPSAWQAGNYWAEGQWGLFNPVTWVLAITARLSGEPVLHATAVKLLFLVLLAGGVYLLARSFAATPPWAALAAVMVPTSGFLVYMDAASWTTDLINIATVAWVWWALRRTVERGKQAWPYLVASYLLITFGYVYGVMVLVVVVVESLVRHIVRRDRARIVRTALAGLWGAGWSIAIYLPALLTAPVTLRGNAPFANLMFLNADLTDLASMGNPWISATIRAWGGDITSAPLVYLSWLLLLFPLLLPVSKRRLITLSPLLVIAAVMLIAVLGPSEMGPIRWPLRFIPYLAMTLSIAFAVLMSRRFARGLSRSGGLGSAAVIAVTAVLSWGNVPQAWKAVAAGALLAGVGLALLRWASRRRTRRDALGVGVAVAVTALFVAGQLYFLPNTPLPSRGSPSTAAELARVLPEPHGDGIVVGNVDASWQQPESWHERLIANLWYFSNSEVSSLYTVLPFQTFTEDLCLGPRGATCETTLDTLWSTDETTGKTVADLMGLSRIIAMTNTYPDEVPAPDGWHLASTGTFTRVYERDEVVPTAGGLVWTGEGTAAEVTAEDDLSVTVTVTSVGSDPRMVLSRLSYPGYSTSAGTLTDPVRGWLLTLDLTGVEPGQSVTVRFLPPGIPIVIGAALIALAAGVGLVVLGRRQSRRRPVSAEAIA